MISHYNSELFQITRGELFPIFHQRFKMMINLGNTVRHKLISRIKEAKYYSIIFDCTPDTAHKEQLCEIIRYVRIADSQCSVEESFIDFINTTG